MSYPNLDPALDRNSELVASESRPSIKPYVFCDLELPLSGIGNGTSRSHLLRNLGQISHRKQSRKSWEIDLRDPDSCLLNTATSPTLPRGRFTTYLLKTIPYNRQR
jgi:hypothetical protein